jgi:hypothetical protein
MQRRNRTQLVLGVLLILVAGWLIAVRADPKLGTLVHWPTAFTWPMWVILAGLMLLVLGLLVGTPGLAVPACIVGGVGGILYYQNATGDWTSWSYMWTLIPGFVGIGRILAGILGDDFKHSVSEGANALMVSIVLFAIFGTFFHAWTIFGVYSPYVPIGLLFLGGIWLIVRGLLRRK